MNRSYKGLKVKLRQNFKSGGLCFYNLQIFDCNYNVPGIPKRVFLRVDVIEGGLESAFEQIAKPWIDLYKKEED